MSQTSQHAPAGNPQSFAQTYRRQAAIQQKATGFVLRIAVILVCFAFLLVFGFFFDRPSRVPAPESEKTLVKVGRLVSAAFHAILSLVLFANFGPIGFAHLPIAILAVARRHSAVNGVPYRLKALAGNVGSVLGARGQGETMSSSAARNAKILRIAVLSLMIITAILGILALFKLPVAGFILGAGSATWALWMFIAFKAAGLNITADEESRRTYSEFIGILRQVFGGSAADWEDVALDLDADGNLVATNPPLSAVLRHDDADAILSKVAPDWELDDSSTPRRLVLAPVSDETLMRRIEEARSGGLIAGRVDSEATETSAPTATVKIADADFFA